MVTEDSTHSQSPLPFSHEDGNLGADDVAKPTATHRHTIASLYKVSLSFYPFLKFSIDKLSFENLIDIKKNHHSKCTNIS